MSEAVQEQTRTLVSWDTETERWAPWALAPRVVCLSSAQWVTSPDGELTEQALDLWGRADSFFSERLRSVIEGPHQQVLCNAKYDLCVAAAYDLKLLPTIFQALAEGRVWDVSIREQLLCLAEFGDCNMLQLPDGSFQRMNGSLLELELIYLGRDRTEEKLSPDAWRNHYGVLMDKPTSEWPEEARDYPMRDAEGTLLVCEAQEVRRQRIIDERGYDPLAAQEFQVAADFCLNLMRCMGWPIDLERKRELEAIVEEELSPERMEILYSADVLRRPQLPKQRKNGTYTKGKDESRDMAALSELIERTCAAHGLEVKRTPTGRVSTAEEVLIDVAPFDPVLEAYQRRQGLIKLKDTELPGMGDLGHVWVPYRSLLNSGRAASHVDDEIPSIHIQGITNAREIKDDAGEVIHEASARQAFVAWPGWVLLSCDYEGNEFRSMAQVCFTLFGHSTMRDLLLRGMDPHAYLGAQLALHLQEGFADYCVEQGANDPEGAYRAFKLLEKSEDPEHQKVYKKYRKLAKPVNFGFPGGLGAPKFVSFARKKPHNVVVTEDQARLFKQIWFATYPEMKDYVEWVEKQKDPRAPGRFVYESPYGLVRAGCAYTEICNGALLQTPAADGLKLALFEVARACYDESYGSCLYGARLLAAIHDELIAAIPEDRWMHERATELARIMVDCMDQVTPDVPSKVEPTLMRRWNKNAKTKHDERGRLAVYEELTV